MDAHPKFHEVAEVCKLAPKRTRALFQVYLDIKYGHMLQSVEAHMLDSIGFPAVIARSAGSRRVFVPVYADEDFSVADLAAIVENAAALAAAGKCAADETDL
ncbi:hypothetical protein IWQ57_005546, partial [Coemansia nantahalensis]|uniref:Uncharacterized protein n=2 Tax=Coemansia TaxID=4863 RepID=A0ACC1L881_9FUNG